MVNSKSTYTNEGPPWLLPPVPSCSEPLTNHASTVDPVTLACGFGSVSFRVSAPFLWVLVHVKFCLYPPSLEPLFPWVLWKAYNQIALAFKVRLPGDFLVPLLDSQNGKLDMGLKIFTTVGKLLWYYFSTVCGSPTQWVWDFFNRDFAPPTISQGLLLCLCTWDSSVLLLMFFL